MKRIGAWIVVGLMLVAGMAFGADQRIQYNERMVGAGHPTLTDTLNRLSVVEHNTDGTHKTIAGNVHFIGKYTGIADALTQLGSTQATLVVNADTTVSTAVTIPSTLSVAVTKGGKFTKSGSGTVTINGPFEAGLYQVFSGFAAGDVTFGAAIEVSPVWWGTDTAAVKAMFASKPSGGSFVFPPNTTYTITEATTGLLVPSNSRIRGHGPSSIIKRGDATTYLGVFSNSDFFDNATGNENITIENLAIDDNGANNSYDEHRHAIVLIGARNVSVEKVYFYGISGDGIYISNTKDATPHASISKNIRIIGNHFDGATKGRNGISIIDGIDIDIIGNTFLDVADNAMPGAIDLEPNLASQSIINVNIIGNSFKNPKTAVQIYNVVGATARNIRIDNNVIANSRNISIVANTATSSSINNNSIYGSNDGGIYVTSMVSSVTINGNSIYSTVRDGIRVVGSSYGTIQGNIIYNWDVGDSTTAFGIRGITASSNNLVSGNSFRRSAANGTAIKTEDACTGWMFGPNFVVSGVTKYSLVGSNTEVTMGAI